jgi:hypothetical protein
MSDKTEDKVEEAIRANTEKKKRLEEERRKHNQDVIRSYRLKK